MQNAELANVLMWAGLIGLVGAFVLMALERRLGARTLTVIGVLLMAGGGLCTGLNPGIDLKGGISLTYEVDLKDSSDSEETLNQIIQVLQNRIDPNGVRNLTWRVEGHNRIEVQMPLASAEVRGLRKTYDDAMKGLGDSVITRGDVLAALRLDGEARNQRLETIAGGVEGRAELLDTAAEEFDARAKAMAAYEAVKDDADKAIDAAGKAAEADLAFNRSVDAVMQTNLDSVRMLEVLQQPTVGKTRTDDVTGEEFTEPSPREKQLNTLIADLPERKAEIESIVKAYDAYQEKKGPLDDADDLKRLMRGAGVLEFRITVDPTEVANVDEMLADLRDRGPRSLRSTSPHLWFKIHDPKRFADSNEEREALIKNPRESLNGQGLIGDEYGGEIYVLLWNTPERSLTRQQTGWELSSAKGIPDSQGFPAVGFEMNARGAKLMGDLTGNNIKRRMAILLDGSIYSGPPNIQSKISGSGIITGGRGGFSQGELKYLVRTLGAGSLSAQLSPEPISERTIGPALGKDNLERGFESAVFALICVALFMMVYYFFAGFVADLALMANIVLILGVMAMLKASFTMPGIAGVVLTIGMCVDANVLIFERIREELQAGRDMVAALRLGYEKAFSSIIDGNITNLIVCVILGYTATAEIKGFAVTLGIGIIATLFTALFMTRVIFDWYYVVMGSKKMGQLPSSVDAIERALAPSIDWVAKRKGFWVVSAVLVVVSIASVFMRGSDLFDIEFRGGTEVEFTLKDELRESVGGIETGIRATLTDATVIGINDSINNEYRTFSILTTNTDADAVSTAVRETFQAKLDTPPVIKFDGHQFEVKPNERTLPGDIVLPITGSNLGQVIGRPEVTNDVSDAVGGVAIVLENLDPPVQLDDLAQRLRAMRLQPDFEAAQFRSPPRVVGITASPDAPDRWSTVVVVSHDPAIDYFDDQAAWETDVARTDWDLVNAALARTSSLNKVTNFTATVAKTMTYNAIVALGLSIIAIVIYIWFRFGSLRFGLSAIVALVHDVAIALGLIAISGWIYQAANSGLGLGLVDFKINMAMIAAILTIIGYSLNDTIIVFDRIRENRGKLAVASPSIMNRSINQTISRSVITSGTTFLAVFVLYVDGGAGIHGFAFAMVVGVLIGTYSSIAIASPLLVVGTKYSGYTGEGVSPEDNRPYAFLGDDSKNEQ